MDRMKRVLEIVVLLAQSVFAGESSLTVTYHSMDWVPVPSTSLK